MLASTTHSGVLMKVKNHTISKPPPVHSAADRQAAEQRHKGAGKGPEKPFSHALSEAQEKHRMNSSCEEGAQKPERSVPLDPRMLRAIGHEAATTQHESAQEQQGAPAQASRSHSRLSITDTNYGLGGKKASTCKGCFLRTGQSLTRAKG